MIRIRSFYILLFLFLNGIQFTVCADNVSTKKERNLITAGNELYNKGRYKEALQKYQAAVKENPSSAVGIYNLGLTELQLGSNPADTTSAAKEMLTQGTGLMERISRMGADKPLLAAKANYNLGNVAFNGEDYKKAIDFYKQSLRLNPDDEAARRNLRIAQLKLQNQDDNQDQDQNQDQNQDQDNQENQQDQEQQQDNQEQQQDQNQNQQEQPQQEQQQQEISPQSAEQILNAMENKENQTRARVANEQGEKAQQRNRNRLNW